MKFPRLFVCAVLFAAFSAMLPAQQAPTGYHRVACIKVKPENNGEFRSGLRATSTKSPSRGSMTVQYHSGYFFVPSSRQEHPPNATMSS
jgi:hypothetical protein